MAFDEQRDRLIHVLLLELYGAEQPPDLARRIVRRVGLERWLRRAGAAAAVALLALALWALLRPGYPPPSLEGDYQVIGRLAADRSRLTRGDAVIAGKRGATLRLGGYCTLRLSPGARLTLRGSPGKERVDLAEGELACRVDPRGGGFTVGTPLGSLEVVGTEFVTTVEPLEKGGGDMGRLKKAVVVSVVVLSGAVAYQFGDQSGILTAGMSRAFGAEHPLPDGIEGFRGILRGTVVSTGKNGFILKVEKIVRVWKHSKAQKPEAVIGKEVEVDLWAESRLADQHRKTLATLEPGDKVDAEVFHFGGDHLSVVEELKKVEEPKEGEAEGSLPEGIRGFRGMLIGTIVAKGNERFLLKVEKVTRVWKHNKAQNPQCIVGKKVEIGLWPRSRLVEQHRATLKTLKVGDRVVVEAFHFGGDELSVVEELKKAE